LTTVVIHETEGKQHITSVNKCRHDELLVMASLDVHCQVFAGEYTAHHVYLSVFIMRFSH